ncbi:MAG TPA: cobaltochelatase subunit CobN [Beijerinckiaceae bacterium]|nr:cobaltochelatase subunit CobN [Beijerinckiaceae bacterium]
MQPLATFRQMLGFCLAVVLSTLPLCAQEKPPVRIRVLTVDFVLPGKFERLNALAQSADQRFDHTYVETAPPAPAALMEGADLVILDTPRPMDMAKLQTRLAGELKTTRVPWLRVGGGPPIFGNLAPEHARALITYYASGGEANLKNFFAYAAAMLRGGDVSTIPAPRPLPATGFYHPKAPRPFATVDDYLRWLDDNGPRNAPRIGIAIHSGLIAAMETKVVDTMVEAATARGLAPIVFWFDAADPTGLEKVLKPAQATALIIATHLQNGPARAAEFARLNMPVMQAISHRDGSIADWRSKQQGMAMPLVAPFLAVPETWGVSDPIVTDAVEKGEPTPIPEQIDLLMAKAARLAALKTRSNADKQLALMFWNYPPGEKNLSASNLNAPRSLAQLTVALAAAGYRVPATSEQTLIEAAQSMLGAVYHRERLQGLLAKDLAERFSLAAYQAWFDRLPAERKTEITEAWGPPERYEGLIEENGERFFIIPRLRLGHLVILPQLPRSGEPGRDYHDGKKPPGHGYLAAYRFLQDSNIDALIHFGTHGTQEWTPGKDRGLAASDYPMLAVGDIPVFYPYIQDNIAEAIQAKRRGRAVTISHQTPPFAPAGLFDELRDMHAKVHEYVQLDDGAVRERTQAELRRLAVATNMHRDMGWSEVAIDKDFPAFLSALHDHLHALAAHAMPLGLHTFGTPAAAEHRLSTVMQQLGEPFYKRVGAEPDEFFARDFSTLKETEPYRFLTRFLRDGNDPSTIADNELRALIERAVALDRHLAEPGEIEALLQGLSGGFVQPGAGGDPIRNPDVASGRNLFAFEADKVPTQAAFEAGAKAYEQLVEAYRAEHAGERPQKLAFSLWAGETTRHLGIVESQILHALGLKPLWNSGGKLTSLMIVPREQLGRARVDVVLQVTSVYRDQFDVFMRMLSGAIDQLAVLDEPDNAVFHNSRRIGDNLLAQGKSEPEARRLAALRIFSNEPGDYGTGLPNMTLKSTGWENEKPLAEAFLARTQYAYGAADWGTTAAGVNLFAEQLKGVQAAVLSRSSRLHGLLSTDHPFEYLGGLSLAVRHLGGAGPSLYIADLRQAESRVTPVARFLSDEIRARYVNPHWIGGMQKEGYAGTLELLNAVNNFWGWQVTDPAQVRADQWQEFHETYVMDKRRLGLNAWFAATNPTAQTQIIERMVEAVRKGYWDASPQTRRELNERLQQLAVQHNAAITEPVTRDYLASADSGFGNDAPASTATTPSAETAAGEQVRGQTLEKVSPTGGTQTNFVLYAALFLVLTVLAGALLHMLAHIRTHPRTLPR